MTAALDGTQRTSLERLVTRARRLLEDDLLERASGRFGIDPNGTIADEDALRLDPTALMQRRELVDVVDHLRSEGEDSPGAVGRLLREATFTHLNRFVAIRIAEALDLLPPSLAGGRSSQGFRDILELVPSLAGDDTGGYWAYLSMCGDELAGDVPALFDPRNPLLALTPSPGALDDIVELLAAADAALWLAPDCLGWVYQFFNTGDERRAMREESAAPRDSRELAVRNQFFTPRYVVDFLVQNSLGRRLIDADPTSPLLDELPLLIDPPEERGEPLDLADASMLDPACGSGHFLLAGYDVLERAWYHAGVDPAEAAPAIVRSLWGIDIDLRCSQVAAAAIVFRARRSCPDGDLPRPNIVCARALPATSTGLDEVLAALPDKHRQLVEQITDAMADAPILGPLLKIEERLAAEVRAAAFGGASGPGSFADELPAETLRSLEDELLAALSTVADATTASAAERLLAAEADDAIRFVHALQRRYDAVCMNPPFGDPVAETKPYLRTAYPWAPSRVDILTTFVGRGIELCNEFGYVGAITNRAGLFLSTFKRWRQEVLLGHGFVTLADLGYRVMAQAKVEAAAYVVGRRVLPNREATFLRILKDPDRSNALEEAAKHSRTNTDDPRVFRVALADLLAIPGSPFAYALSPSIRRLFAELPALGEDQTEVRVGLQTGDDARFVRAFWEVRPDRIARTLEDTRRCRWVPFAKGGEYSPYWADVHLVVDWEHDGERIRDYSGARPQNTQFYFRPGLTWSLRTNSALSMRILPAGCIFSNKGNIVESARSLALLGWLNSRYARLLIEATGGGGDEDKTDVSRSYEVGLIRALPDPTGQNPDLAEVIGGLALQAAELVARDDEDDETSRRFVVPAALRFDGLSLEQRARAVSQERLARAVEVVTIHDQIDSALQVLLDPLRTAEAALIEADGPLVSTLPDGPTDPALLSLPISEVVSRVTERCGVARWIGVQHQAFDRRLELAAVAERASPKALVEALPIGYLPPEEPLLTANEVLSYLIGVSFGRWDTGVARDPRSASAPLDVFAPVPICPPGMAATAADESGANSIPPDGVLVDQPGHEWDVSAAVEAAARLIFKDGATDRLDEIRSILGRDIPDHLRRRFFRDHLTRYSKSKRRAPIYWALYVPSGLWGVWLYAPVLSRETLFAVGRIAGERLDNAEVEIRRLARERETHGNGRSDREVANALEAEEKLIDELRRFRNEVDRVAGLGWEPDLDDGIVLCAAPLADLFPAWKDATAARKEIKAGKYPWATVSKWAEQL